MLHRLDWTGLPPEVARETAAAVLFKGDQVSLHRVEVSGRQARLPFYESAYERPPTRPPVA